MHAPDWRIKLYYHIIDFPKDFFVLYWKNNKFGKMPNGFSIKNAVDSRIYDVQKSQSQTGSEET